MEWTWFTWRQHQQCSAILLNSIAQCASRRAHLSSSRVLLSSHSLAPSLQQVTSSPCQRLHTCARVQYQPSEEIHWSRSSSSPISNHPTCVQPSVRQRQSPPATILAGRRSRLAGEAGSSTDGCCSSVGGTHQPGKSQPGSSRGGKPESWRGASAYQPADCGELNEDEGRNQKK